MQELIYIFDKSAKRPLYVIDRNGNKITYTYNNEWFDEIKDDYGRVLKFYYTAVENTTYLWKVVDNTDPNNPREVVFAYEASGSDQNQEHTLRSIQDPLGNTYTLRYQAVLGSFQAYYLDNVKRMEYPAGNYHYEYHWDEYTYKASNGYEYRGIKVDKAIDANGHETNIIYNNAPYYTEVTYPDNTMEKYYHDSSHTPTKQLTDAQNQDIYFEKDEHNRITKVTDRLGNETTITYHGSGKIASITNAKGKTITFEYTPQEQTFTNPDNGEQFSFIFYNLSKITYPDGKTITFTYDSKGNIIKMTDRAGNTYQYEYDAHGFLTKVTLPTGGTITYTYNSDATLASMTTSDTGTITFAYDSYKRFTKITYPDGKSVSFSYDKNDRLTSYTDAEGNTWQFTYDENGNLIEVKDPHKRGASLMGL